MIWNRLFGIGRDEKIVPAVSRAIPFDVQQAADRVANDLQVDPRLHPSDFIFWSILENHGEGSPEKIVKEYFEGGRSTAVYIRNVIEGVGRTEVPRMLDFAAGYARLARHFPVIMPNTRVTVSDIHDEALVFARQLGFKARASSWDPLRFKPGQHELVIAISFLTHMPRETWANWLGALGRAVAPGGIMLITTHGLPALEPMGLTQVEPDGFGYFMQSEQADLALANYASTVTLPEYVRAAARDNGLEIVSFQQGGFGYQDLWLLTPKTGDSRRR